MDNIVPDAFQHLTRHVDQFIRERDWYQFHSPKNLAMALSVEAAELLEYFELAAKVDTPAEDLSRGMRQKLAICCGYLHDPDVILLDEPMTGLDPHGIRTLKDSIRRLAGLGAAVIVSSHLLAMVEDICSHVLILKRGRQKYWGTLDGLKSSYVSDADQATLEEIFFRATEMDSVVEFQL